MSILAFAVAIFVLTAMYFLIERWKVFKSLPESPPYHFSIVDCWCVILTLTPTLWLFGYLTRRELVQWTGANILAFAAMIAGHYAGFGSGAMEYEVAKSAGVGIPRYVYLFVFSIAGGSVALLISKVLLWFLVPGEADRIISPAL